MGTTIGSLAKALADRSLTDRSFWGRSHCENCKHKLSWYDLFPILSYLLLNGRCRYCKNKFSIEYPAVELLSAILVAFIFLTLLPANILDLGYSASILILMKLLFSIFIVCVLLTVMLTDLKTGLIPDRITYPAITIGFFFLLFLSSVKIYLIYLSTVSSSLGKFLLPPYSTYYMSHVQSVVDVFLINITSGVFTGLFFLLLILVTKGKGMGGGDMKLGIFLGLVLGFPNIFVAISLAFLTGAIVGVILIIFGKRRLGQTIPFGPFMSLGAILALILGENILSWYLNLSLIS